MSSKRYVVVSPQRLRELPSEEFSWGSRADYGSGQVLVYRDNFVAYKVAARTGGRVIIGRVLCEGESCSDEARLEDGERIGLELEPVIA